MPTVRQTLEQWEDAHGIPIVLLTAWDVSTQKWVTLRVRDLPLTAIAVIVQWLNDRASSA